MKNIKLTWAAPLDPTVTGYNIYHGSSEDNLQILSSMDGIQSTLMIVYPDQLGYKENDTVHLAVESANLKGQSARIPSNTVTLPVEMQLPLPPTNVVAVLIDA